MSYLFGGQQSVVVALTSAQLRTLFTQPVTLLPAPGVGFMIVPVTAYFSMLPGSQMFGSGGTPLITLGQNPIGDNPDIDPGSSYSVTASQIGVFDNVKKDDGFRNIGPFTLTSVGNATTNTISHIVETPSNIVTLLVGGATPYVAGMSISLSGLTTGTWLNGHTITLQSGTGEGILVFTDPTSHGTQAPHSETGTATGGTTIYTGSITGGATDAYAPNGDNQIGYRFTVTGFTNANNNGIFQCAHSSASTLELVNSNGVSETHTASVESFAYSNLPLMIQISANSNDLVQGGIATAHVSTAGTGYNIGDTGSISDGVDTDDATYTVLTLTGGAGSGIATFTLTYGGCNISGANGYLAGGVYNDTNPSGGGSGAAFTADTIVLGNGTAKIVLTYNIVPTT